MEKAKNKKLLIETNKLLKDVNKRIERVNVKFNKLLKTEPELNTVEKNYGESK